ncbi:MAG: preprotein translocase subunit SecE [Planctomycetes bacterium]|nr:preprotein translocase subunit SecE [Planctomycetota bacterium]
MLTQIYKPGQGKYSRLGSGFAVGIVVAIGCYNLFGVLQASEVNPWIATLVPAGILVAFGVALYWLLNKPSAADFLIAAEGELKKVNWSSRKEVAVSTLVVIIVVIVMAVLLGTTDFIFQLVFRQLIG